MDQNISAIKRRMIELVEYQGISKRHFYRNTGISNGILDKKGGVSEDNIERFLSTYGEINAEWLLRGEGPMITDEKNLKKSAPNYLVTKTSQSAPYYNIPVQAGNDTEIFSIDTDPHGHIDIPGVSAIAFFPVIGFSMEPTIRNGDIIGIDEIDSWDRMDPDKIYYIITDSDRMIKHLSSHQEDDDVLICISPNYKEFSIRKENVKAIYRVVFYGRIA